MAKNQNTQVAQNKATEQTTGADTDEKSVVELNTGAEGAASQGAPDVAANVKGETQNADDATLADVGDVARAFVPKTLSEHVSGLLAHAEKNAETANQSVLNRIHVKLAEFKHTLSSIEQHVLDAASEDVIDLLEDLKRML